VEQELLGDGVDLAAGHDMLGSRLTPDGEVRRGAVRLDRGLVGVELVEDEVMVVGGVDGDVEVPSRARR
jgi:hypothetical protein